MPIVEPIGLIRPDPHTPKTLGVLNIGFALMLMLGGLCINAFCLMPPILTYIAGMVNEEMIKEGKTRHDKILKLWESENETSDEELKLSFQTEREELEAQPPYDPSRLTMLSNLQFRDPRFIGHFVLDLGTGLVFNLFMLASGIGLYFLKRWGRVLAMIVAWAKILRLLALALSVTLILSPLVASLVTEFETALPAEGIAPVGSRVGTLLTGFAWTLFLLGSVYPVATLLLLRRPSVKTALEVSGGQES